MFITEALKNWKVELRAGGKVASDIKNQWSIFQVDPLFPLPFVIAMNSFTHIFKI